MQGNEAVRLCIQPSLYNITQRKNRKDFPLPILRWSEHMDQEYYLSSKQPPAQRADPRVRSSAEFFERAIIVHEILAHLTASYNDSYFFGCPSLLTIWFYRRDPSERKL
jgi:hypothetical protein